MGILLANKHLGAHSPFLCCPFFRSLDHLSTLLHSDLEGNGTEKTDVGAQKEWVKLCAPCRGRPGIRRWSVDADAKPEGVEPLRITLYTMHARRILVAAAAIEEKASCHAFGANNLIP